VAALTVIMPFKINMHQPATPINRRPSDGLPKGLAQMMRGSQMDLDEVKGPPMAPPPPIVQVGNNKKLPQANTKPTFFNVL
jgi:hypothetical protein